SPRLRDGSDTPSTFGLLCDLRVAIAVAASPIAAAPPASSPVFAFELALPTVSAAFFAPLVTVSVTVPSLLWPFADDREALLWAELPFLDFALVLFERERLAELRPLEDFFCVWAIPALLSQIGGSFPRSRRTPERAAITLGVRPHSSSASWRSA